MLVAFWALATYF